MKKYILSLIAMLVFLVGCASKPNKQVSETSEQVTESSEIKTVDVTKDFIDYSESNALPSDFDKATIEGEKLTIEFDYNSKFGEYMKQLREINNVDNRIKTYFEDNDIKEVELKSSVGNMILSTEYGVKFIL